ncbi:MAG: hypothetical protein Q4P29_07595 [Tissierellia bacterium]|nr:hypothetical protein [Tissierellia bacterium]
MKRKTIFTVVTILLLALLLTACAKDNAKAPEEPKDEEIVVEKDNKKEKEFVPEEEYVDEMSDLKVVACSVNAVKVLDLLGYKNVVAVPDGVDESLYPDAIRFGPETNLDYDLIKELKPSIIIADGEVDYEVKPSDVHITNQYGQSIGATYYSFENIESTKNAINNIGRSLGIKNMAEEIAEKLETNI